MTRSRKSFFRRISLPRILNYLAIAIILSVIYTMCLPQNTAQEAPANPASTPAAATEAAPAIPPTETPAVKSEGEKADEAKEPTPTAESTGATSLTFPVVEGDPSTPASFEELPAPEKTETKPAAPPIPFTQTGTFTLLVFFVLIVGSFFFGNVLSKAWRLPDHNIRIAVLFLAFFGSIAAVFMGWHRLTLGIDLQGGVVLVYDAKPIQRGGDTQAVSSGVLTPDVMDQLTRAITKRINPGGVREISITKLGSQQIQVIIPNAEEAEVARIERVISESGALTFRVLASRLYPQDAQIISRAEKETSGRDIRDASGKLLARWVPVFESEKESFIYNTDIVTRQRLNSWDVLVLFNDGVDVTGEYLTSIGKGMGEGGEPGVNFRFNNVGANKFHRLTSANKPDPAQARLKRYLGIILNDSLYSAPSINSPIRESGIITFSRRHTEEARAKLNQEIDDLISILDAGALPAELSKEPVSRMQIGATLGTDTIQKGKVALVASAVVVLVFMLIYYRLAGVIACFCVVTNIAMLVAIMLALRAAFTLPGLAGIVLTIGMAVDANILIYERLREELRSGASLKMAIRNAYAKALSAIVDSNITTIITGVILYTVGTEQVKGFAVTLVLGVALSMFTAIYCARTIMDIFEAQRWIKTFKMMQLFKRPNINFLGARNACAVFSIVLTVIGMAAVVARGKGIFDIDFVGGVNVEAVFVESQDVGKIRKMLNDKDATISEEENKLNDLAVQSVLLAPTDVTPESALFGGKKQVVDTHYIITTSIPQLRDKEILPEQYLNTVRGILKETFGDSLVYGKFEYTIGETAKVGDNDETEVKLSVFPTMNQAALISAVGAAIQRVKNAKLIENDFSYTVSREDFIEGSQQSFADWNLKAHASKDVLEKVFAPLKAELDGTPYFPTSTTVGGSVAKDTRIAGLAAVIGSLIVIILYIWFRFSKLVYGIAAAIGLVHDVLIALGLIALSYWVANLMPGFSALFQIEEFKIGLPVVAAFLTIIGYSLNDTIILFDRIRENKGKSPILTDTMINNSINQTLSRTVLTSLTTFFVAIILYFWGGQGIHTFAFAMSCGVAFGTYSTIGLCAPLLYWMAGTDDPNRKSESEFAVSEK